MRIIYNDEVISKSNNIQDLILQLIYKKIRFFINKPNFKINELIPNTLRGYTDLANCFKNDSCFNDFENYLIYRIGSEFDNEKVEVFNRLINSSDEMFFIHLLNYLTEYSDEKSEIDTEILYSKNPYNISVADIVYSFIYIEENLKVNDYWNKKYIEFLNIYTSFRILKLDKDKKSDRKWNFNENLLLGGFVNDHFIIFPKENKSDSRRDQITFSYKKIVDEYPEEIDEIWLNFFITSMGVLKNDYRSDNENVFEKKRMTRTYDHACFSPIFPLMSPFILIDRLDRPANALILECEEWVKANKDFKNLLINPLFINEFNQNIDYYTKYKEKETHGEYADIIYNYIFKGIISVIKDLNKKYPFIDCLSENLVLKNPVFLYWNENKEKCSEIINSIHKNKYVHDYSDNAIKLAALSLEKYERYFDKNIRNTSQGTKQAMNFLIKQFTKEKTIHEELLKYRRLMDRQFNSGLNNIHNLLIRVSNG